MRRVKIFTNSCCDLSPALAEKLGVTLIPDTIVFEGREYRTNIDITPPEIYDMMDSSLKLPTTSHPNISVYEECFRSCGECDEILCLTITSKMSGTYSTACTSADMLKQKGFAPSIYIYDSMQVSYGLSLMVVMAAALADKGLPAVAIISELDRTKQKIGVYFLMQSLKNAKKGGRVGAIRTLAADILGVKPLLVFRDGLVRDAGIMRNYPEGLNAIVEKYRSGAKYGGTVFIFHTDDLPDAQSVATRIREIDPAADIHIEWVGAAIGIYTGRGCVGISFIEK